MQIFLPYSDILMTARCLDKRRLHKQIVECKQIIKAIKGESMAWKNHPIVKMYSTNLNFVIEYLNVLENYFLYLKSNLYKYIEKAEVSNINALSYLPNFINDNYLNTMKGRLYIKDPDYYSSFFPFKEYGDKNMYFVNGEWKIYKQKT